MLPLGDPAINAPPPGAETDAEQEAHEQETSFKRIPKRGPFALAHGSVLQPEVAVVATFSSALSLLSFCPHRAHLGGGLLVPEHNTRGGSVRSDSLVNQIRFAGSNSVLCHLDAAAYLAPHRHRALVHALRTVVAPSRWVVVTAQSASVLQGSASNGSLVCLPSDRERTVRSSHYPLPEFAPGMLLPDTAGAVVSAAQAHNERALALVACEDGPPDASMIRALAQALDAEVPGLDFAQGAQDAATAVERSDLRTPSVYS